MAVAACTVAIAAASATSAYAFPSKVNACDNCHLTDTRIVVTATQTANDGVNATYSVRVSNPFGDTTTGWAVFSGTSNIKNGYSAGTFVVPVGKSYDVWGVAGAGGQGTNFITISPAAPAPVDTVAPVVGLTAPVNGATVSGNVPLAANATDAMSGVNRVEFRVDGVLVGTDSAAPYTGLWDSSLAAPGAHVIEAKAFDNAGLSAASSVSVNIAAPAPVDTTAPVVALTSPANGAIVSGTVGITADATDAMSGVNRVEFRVDGVLVGTDSAAPFSGAWDSSLAAPGTHVIEAKAFDNVGLSAVSSVSVTISAPTPPPVVVSTSATTISVTSLAGAPMAGAKIAVKNTVTGVRYVGVTDSTGTFSIAALPYGNYSVLASARGYKRAVSTFVADAPTEAVAVTLLGR